MQKFVYSGFVYFWHYLQKLSPKTGELDVSLLHYTQVPSWSAVPLRAACAGCLRGFFDIVFGARAKNIQTHYIQTFAYFIYKG